MTIPCTNCGKPLVVTKREPDGTLQLKCPPCGTVSVAKPWTPPPGWRR